MDRIPVHELEAQFAGRVNSRGTNPDFFLHFADRRGPGRFTGLQAAPRAIDFALSEPPVFLDQQDPAITNHEEERGPLLGGPSVPGESVQKGAGVGGDGVFRQSISRRWRTPRPVVLRRLAPRGRGVGRGFPSPPERKARIAERQFSRWGAGSSAREGSAPSADQRRRSAWAPQRAPHGAIPSRAANSRPSLPPRDGRAATPRPFRPHRSAVRPGGCGRPDG